VAERPIALPPAPERERAVIEQPDLDSYSISARICLGVAIFGVALLVTVLTGNFVMH